VVPQGLAHHDETDRWGLLVGRTPSTGGDPQQLLGMGAQIARHAPRPREGRCLWSRAAWRTSTPSERCCVVKKEFGSGCQVQGGGAVHCVPGKVPGPSWNGCPRSLGVWTRCGRRGFPLWRVGRCQLRLTAALDGGQAKVDLKDKDPMERPGAGAGSDQQDLTRQGGGKGRVG